MAHYEETRRLRGALRASDTVSRQIDSFEDTTQPRIINRLTRRLGVSIEVAAVLAELAALGPREARHG